VLTSEAPTSWLADARKRGLATDVSVTATATGGGTLGLAFVTLTAEGQKDPRGVLASLLRYLEEKPTQELVTSLQQLSRVQFDTLEDDSLMDAVERWGAGAEFAPEDVLAGGRVMLQVDMPLVESMFANLTAAHLSAVLLDPGFAAAPGDKHEEWYDAPYRVEPLALVGKPRLLRGGAKFPPALQYVPTLLAVQNASAGAAPEELRPRVWWQGHGNARRKLPTATVFVKLAREGTDQALGAWAAEAVQELAADAADPFTSAGLDMGVEYRGDALQFTFSGYDQYLPDFMAAVLPAVRRAAAAPSAKLKAAQARAAAQYDDPEAEAAYEYALEALSAESNADRKPRREVARALHAASVADLRHWLEAPVAPVQLYYGNVNRSAADQAARHVEFLLGSKKAAPGRTRVRQLAARSRWSLATPAGSDTVSLVAFQTQPSVAQRANLVVLGEFLRPLVYQKLRTEQSLGYIVDAFVNAHLDVVELKVLIQGSKDPAEMSSAVFACLDSAVEDLRALPDSQVHALRAAATTALTTDASMDHEAKRLWHEVHSDQRCFARRAAEAEELASVTAASLVATLQGLLAAGSSRVELSPNATDEALNATTTLFPVVACH